MKEKPSFPPDLDEYPSGALAYRDLEHSFLTFYQRNARLKNSLSWRMTLPIRQVTHHNRRWRARFARLRLAAQHLQALFQHTKQHGLAALWRTFREKGRAPTHIDLAYHHWRKAHPLPRLNDDEVTPRRLLVLISPEALRSPDYPVCLASLQEQRGCTVVVNPLSDPLPTQLDVYDAIIWMRTAAMLVPDYGQIACRALSDGSILFYADHDTHLSTILHERPFFKPAFSPELLGQVDYLAAGCALSPDWLAEQGRPDDSYLYEMLRHLSSSQVRHLPLCLSHLPASVSARLVPPISPAAAPSPPIMEGLKVSLVIPTAFHGTYLQTLLESLYRTTEGYREQLETIIITNKEPEQAEAALKDCLMPCRLIYYDRDFNYSAVNNEAVRQTEGAILFFLNDDIEFKDAYWLPDMLALLQRPQTGAVGSLLLYPDNTIQHAGCLIGMNGGVGHIGVGLPADTDIYHGILTAQREVSAVTGACLAIRRDIFLKAGMFDEHLPLSFNDVALCLRLRDLGYTQYVTTRSRIIHHESRSRGYDVTARKHQANREHFLYARTRYPGIREADPYYSPNLDLSSVYLGYASRSSAQQARFLRPPSPGCLILLAQRMDYDPSTQSLVDMLAQHKTEGLIRLIIAGTNETRFSRQCCAALAPAPVRIEPVQNLRNALLNAPEGALFLDLRLLEVMDGLPPDLPLIGIWVHDGRLCFTDLFGRRTLQQQSLEQSPIDLSSLILARDPLKDNMTKELDKSLARPCALKAHPHIP
ncbi:glycosyltransferase [Gluconacetobacter sacchari DSM 12717]|uniref:Glycosyltransferase n=2 Tax=Gluconacetobacter sacchari TaxID=92759 RepID=A0A7W4IF42_9PROT|nr:glycosyltransferase [Gluconacetobacter sacchari]MBB2161708.1 glycosyltransferase [Gluconacetobacter sacchari]GBQ29462.1 glycosyltransferase [Gluconacetobacter sacchari DSM 12717]